MAAWGRIAGEEVHGPLRVWEVGLIPTQGGDGTPRAEVRWEEVGLEGQVRTRGGRLERTFPTEELAQGGARRTEHSL